MKILLSDDDNAILIMLLECLKSLNHEVREFNNGKEALEHFLEYKGEYDLLITDIDIAIF